jgi:hypothetical protein
MQNIAPRFPIFAKLAFDDGNKRPSVPQDKPRGYVVKTE